MSYVFPNSIAIVTDPLTSFVPALPLAKLDPLSLHLASIIIRIDSSCFFLRVNTYFHTVIEERIRFCKVHNIESYRKVFPGVFYLIKEPLGVSCSVDVILHQQVVFIVTHFLS